MKKTKIYLSQYSQVSLQKVLMHTQLFSSFGLWSIIIAELIMYIIQILIFIFKIRYQRRDKKYVL